VAVNRSGVLRRLARRSAFLRALVNHRLRRQTLRLLAIARVLRPASAFLVGELRGGTRRYRTASGATVVLRHRSRDVDLVEEIFGAVHAYEPPDAIAAQLRGPLRILDLGGNIGLFGAFALGRWDVQEMTSFEPDPENAAILQATIDANHVTDRWSMRRAAVSNATGMMSFLPGHLAESRRTERNESGIDVPTRDLFSLDHRVDLLKIDIEGSEWPILADPRLSDLRARVLVMEWHWRFALVPDAHAAALTFLIDAGYEIQRDSVDPQRGHTGLIWASRPSGELRASARRLSEPRCRGRPRRSGT
jgi:FkbM family methyltransferase